MHEAERIEWLLEQPCWVIDLLPEQVPAGSEGQFFAVERHLLRGGRHEDLWRRFAEVLLKLNCYHDFLVFCDEEQQGRRNPSPKKLERWIVRNKKYLSVLMPAEDALVVVPTSSTYMAIHNPSPKLLEQLRQLAAASGLFVWEPPREG